MPTTLTVAADLPRTDRTRAPELARAELAAMLSMLRSLDSEDWRKPTDCARWDVGGIISHLVGQSDEANPFVAVRHMREGRRRYPELTRLDGMNQVQVDDHRGVPPERLVQELARRRSAAIRSQSRMPRLLRRISVDPKVPGMPTTSLGYLADVIYIRDMWMHRVDISRATGRTFAPGKHSGEVVEQVIRDLALDWAEPACILELTGAVNRRWLIGRGEPIGTVCADTVDYLRVLAGRNTDPDIITEGDPSLAQAARASRTIF